MPDADTRQRSLFHPYAHDEVMAAIDALHPAIEVPDSLKLMINGDGASYSFFYDAGDGWHQLKVDDDGSILSTEKAGGFVGTVLGPFARQE